MSQLVPQIGPKLANQIQVLLPQGWTTTAETEKGRNPRRLVAIFGRQKTSIFPAPKLAIIYVYHDHVGIVRSCTDSQYSLIFAAVTGSTRLPVKLQNLK